MGVQTHPTLSLTVIALEASHADSHKSRDHSLQGYLFHATGQGSGSGSTSSFRLWSRTPLTQQKISIRRYTRVCPIMAQDRRYLLCSFRRMSGSLIIQGYRGEMSKVVGTGDGMAGLQAIIQARLISGPHISFPNLQKHNSKERIPASTFGSKKYVPFRTLLNSNQFGAGIHWSSTPHQTNHTPIKPNFSLLLSQHPIPNLL
jgi:hypothetical protein